MMKIGQAEIRLRCARAGSWRGLWRATRWWTGIAFIGFVVSAIGWVNVLASAVRGEPAGLEARPYEWFFAVGGALIIVLALTMELGPWLSARYGRPVRLHPKGVTYFGHVTVPWERFVEVETIPGAGGRTELAGRTPAVASVTTRLAPYVISGDRLSLGDVGDGPGAAPSGVLETIRGWRESAAGG